MEKCSYFIENKGLFGSYPSQETVDILEKEGVRYFVDLTEKGEINIKPYKTKYEYINYPVKDFSYPENWKTFSQLIIKISKILEKNEEKVFIHCKGGHGRSGILVACILCYIYNIHPYEAIKKTSYYHSKRPLLKEKWKKMGSPQGKNQKDFVYKFFRPLFYHKYCKASYSIGLHNYSPHPVKIDNHKFPNAYFALQYFKAPNNIVYVENLKKGKYELPTDLFNPEWSSRKDEYLYFVLKNKFLQNPNILRNFLNTGLRSLIKVKFDNFITCNRTNQRNILEKLRKELFESEI